MPMPPSNIKHTHEIINSANEIPFRQSCCAFILSQYIIIAVGAIRPKRKPKKAICPQSVWNEKWFRLLSDFRLTHTQRFHIFFCPSQTQSSNLYQLRIHFDGISISISANMIIIEAFLLLCLFQMSFR